MIKLNLTASGKAQELILAYLQENASGVLADKINNGVPIEKDGKRLISKKDLNGFMSYANSEARKLDEKGANAACIEDSVVYGWAIHYFEEDSLEGKLYNEDGTEYKAIVKNAPKPEVKEVITKPKQQQTTLFDMLQEKAPENSVSSSILPPQSQKSAVTEEKVQKPITPVICADERKKQPSVFYQTYLQLIERHEGFLILLRLGDFYEALNDHATTLASELNLTLTGRDCGLDNRIPMVGIPYHAVDCYVNKLIERGYKVVLAEDLNNTIEFKDIDEEEPEELSVEEMREFDSYVDEEVLNNLRRKQNHAFAIAQPNLRKPAPQQVNACDLLISEPQQSQAEGSALKSRKIAGASSRDFCEDDLPTVSKIVGSSENDEDDEEFTEILNAESAKAFDKESLCIISELFDGEITLA